MQQTTLHLLQQLKSDFEEEQLFQKLTTDFVHRQPAFWLRSTLEGHLTGSAWILNPERDKALLIHHRTLDKWFQPGGHTEENDQSLLDTARREATEETGVQGLKLLSEQLFDLDIHIIPQKGDIPAHLHYDLRFAFEAQSEELSGNFSEVKGLTWMPLDTLLRQLDSQQSLRRMAIKSLLLSAF